jgi:murein DD-endopeptidase MepM/ murein hydrolase activator NlpD
VVAVKSKVREDNLVTGSIAPLKKPTVMKPVVQDNLVKTSATTPVDSSRSDVEFRWPLRSAKVISNFGDDLNGIPNEGINFSVPEGTEIRAAEEGEVVYAGNGSREPSLKNYGNLILLRHADKYVTVYAHAKDLNVKVGDKVKRGQVIGRVGQTGSVSSPQLHFEVRQGRQSIDPEQKIRG